MSAFTRTHFTIGNRVTMRLTWWAVVSAEIVFSFMGHSDLGCATWSALWVFAFVDWAHNEGVWGELRTSVLTLTDTSMFRPRVTVMVGDEKYRVVKVTSPTTVKIRRDWSYKWRG